MRASASIRLVGHRRPVLVARLLVLRAPAHFAALEVDVRPPEVADGTDAVSRLVCEHERDVKPPVDLPRYFKKRLILLVGHHDAGGVLLRRRLQAFERIRFKKQTSLFVPRLRRPVEDRDQELQVVLDGPVGHRLAARSDPARPPRPDEPIPIPLRQSRRVSALSEEPEKHPHRGLVVPLGRLALALALALALGGRHLLTVDVKKRSQRERLGRGLLLAVRLRLCEPGGELVRLPLGPRPVAVPQRPTQPSSVLSPLDLEQAGFGIGKHPDPVPAPFAGAVTAPTSFRACHRSIPLD